MEPDAEEEGIETGFQSGRPFDIAARKNKPVISGGIHDDVSLLHFTKLIRD